jgi:hypothetical protein
MTNFRVEQIPSFETYEWLLYKHYAKRIPSISYAFGLYDNKKLIGVCTFGSPPSQALCVGLMGKEYKDYVIELNRLCVDSNKKNTTSWFVSHCLKLLPQPLCVVSYADTSQGHIGKIYQACNFIYTGLSDKRSEWRMIGSNLHSKTVSEKYTLEERKSSEDFYITERPRKHRYIYFIGNKNQIKDMKSNLKYDIKPYPKGETRRYDASYKPFTQGLLF